MPYTFFIIYSHIFSQTPSHAHCNFITVPSIIYVRRVFFQRGGGGETEYFTKAKGGGAEFFPVGKGGGDQIFFA